MKLKELRKQKGVTQEDVSNAINVKRFTYSNYETGKTEPTIDVLIKLANYFEVSVDKLLGRENNQMFNFSDLDEIQKLIFTSVEQLNKKNQAVLLGYIQHMLYEQNLSK